MENTDKPARAMFLSFFLLPPLCFPLFFPRFLPSPLLPSFPPFSQFFSRSKQQQKSRLSTYLGCVSSRPVSDPFVIESLPARRPPARSSDLSKGTVSQWVGTDLTSNYVAASKQNYFICVRPPSLSLYLSVHTHSHTHS